MMQPNGGTVDTVGGLRAGVTAYPPRIRAFRDYIIKALPRVPNTRASREALRAMGTHRLILAYLTWRMRLIPAKPRMVKIWGGGVPPWEFELAKPKLRHFLEKVEAGKDLTAHLSDLVNTTGVVLPGARATSRGLDIDMVLTRQGLHHFHVGRVSRASPKGRSNNLIFAEVLESEFRIVALSDHRAFDIGSPEQLRFFQICHSYMARDVPPGQGFMANPVLSSGHLFVVTMFSDKCDDEMQRLDPQLDDSAFIDKLYNDQPIEVDGRQIGRPAKPCLSWRFEDLQFGIFDAETRVFFCLYSFFAR
jgi:hypothetical protein